MTTLPIRKAKKNNIINESIAHDFGKWLKANPKVTANKKYKQFDLIADVAYDVSRGNKEKNASK